MGATSTDLRLPYSASSTAYCGTGTPTPFPMYCTYAPAWKFFQIALLCPLPLCDLARRGGISTIRLGQLSAFTTSQLLPPTTLESHGRYYLIMAATLEICATETTEKHGQHSSPSAPPEGDEHVSTPKKPMSWYLAFFAINISTFIVSLDATALAVAVPVCPL